MSEDREQGGFGWLARRQQREPDPVDEAGEGSRTVPGMPAASTRRRRRKTGKRSNPHYEQASAYVRRTVYRRVKQALLAQEGQVQYSDLVESLLLRWLDEVGWSLDEEEEGFDSLRRSRGRGGGEE